MNRYNLEKSYSERFCNPLPYGAKGSDERSKYHAKTNELGMAFRQALEKDFKAEKLPIGIRDKIYLMAWSRGHANGYDEVAFEYADLAAIALAAFAAGARKGK